MKIKYFVSYVYRYAGDLEFRNAIIECKKIKTVKDITRIEKQLDSFSSVKILNYREL